MGFSRAQLRSGGLVKDGRPGDGLVAHLSEFTQNADSNQVISVSAINAGLYIRGGMTAGRTDTTDTAAAIIAANPDMDINDSFVWLVSVTVAFALTLGAGAGVTLLGNSSVAANGFRMYVVTRTGAATVSIRGL
jgi:hypothetical protein